MTDAAGWRIDVVGDDEDRATGVRDLLAFLRSDRELSRAVTLRAGIREPGELGPGADTLVAQLTSFSAVNVFVGAITEFLQRSRRRVKIRLTSPTGTAIEVAAGTEPWAVVVEVAKLSMTGGPWSVGQARSWSVGQAMELADTAVDDTVDINMHDFAVPTGTRRSLSTPATLPVTIYLSNEEGHEQVEAAVEQVLTVAGLEISSRGDPVLGSWFRDMWATVTKKARTPAGQEALLVAAHAAETRLVLAPDADVTTKLLQGVGPVITSLESTQHAVIRLGNVLIVKVNGVVTVVQLTAAQQLLLNHRPELACSPHEILAALNETSLNDGTSNKAAADGRDSPPALH